MKKKKIVVYAITKNEEKFVDRWINSMKEADEIYVLDTGSTDNTVNLLKENNVNVTQKIINPWRFDVARNESLKLVPNDTDICVCTDLDEIFESGWRNTLEQIWDDSTTRLAYNYNWLLENNVPKVNFYIEKIHTRNNYEWTHPVHEVLKYIGNKNEIKKTTDKITLNHYPDITKSRNSYLPLLELSVKENPDDDRNMHYLGREYMYYKQWNKAIDTLIKHLNLKKSTWKDERCASMRFISRCYNKLNKIEESRLYAKKAIDEAPYLRDPYVEFALIEYEHNNWDTVIELCNKALKIRNHPKTYINEIFSWDYTIYDLLSLALYNQNRFEESFYYVCEALKMEPNNIRLINNKKIIQERMEKKC